MTLKVAVKGSAAWLCREGPRPRNVALICFLPRRIPDATFKGYEAGVGATEEDLETWAAFESNRFATDLDAGDSTGRVRSGKKGKARAPRNVKALRQAAFNVLKAVDKILFVLTFAGLAQFLVAPATRRCVPPTVDNLIANYFAPTIGIITVVAVQSVIAETQVCQHQSQDRHFIVVIPRRRSLFSLLAAGSA